MSDVLTIQGAKAGNKQPKRPSIADDTIGSISRLKMVIGLSEGEVKGLANGAASIMLEGTPLLDDNGNPNFEGVEWDIRHGTVDQTYIAGMPSASTEIGVGTIVRSGTPWVRSVSNTQLSSINVNISFPLLKKVESDGDVVGVSVDYVIEVQTDGNGYVPVVTKTLKAKTSGRYQRTHNVTLPDAQNNWQIRVRKVTEDGDNETLFNTLQVDSIAEVIDGKFNYPHTAHLYLSFDARTFSNIPKVTVDMLGVYVQVPVNYDTETRTSTGLWNGQFKLGYTTNPAWHHYNLITNDRYGLGDKLQAFMIDKWALEHIARVCDEPVDDGKGGTEPRFECNLYLQKAEDAYQVLQHIAGIFRGMSFWNGSKIIVDADTQRDCEYVITRANVIDGHFSKTGSAASDRHTIAKVAYSDPNNSYDTEYVMVRNERAIAQQGINVLDLSAVGCTSEGQAYRMGLAALLAEQNRTQTVSFAMGLDGALPTVGSRIDIPDMMFTGANNSGRISSVSSNRRVITVDRDNVPATVGDKLMVNLESGKAQSRVITAISGRAITVAIAFDAVAAENVWSVISDELPTMPFIVMSVVQNDDATQYNYTALQYDPSMYSQIDNGTIIEQRPPVPDNNPYIINAPDTVTIGSRSRVVQGQNITTLVITWAQVKDAVAYDVEWRKDDGDWVKLPRTGNISAEVEGVYSGNYLARVKAVSAFDAVSKPSNSMLTNIKGKVGVPPAIVGLKATGVLFGIDLKWSFGAGSGDSDYTEIQVGSAPNVNVATLGQFGYPTNSHTINGLQGNLSQSYRARLVDKLGNKSVWSAWVTATTDASADKVMDLIQGQIDESALDQALRSEIGKIDTNKTLLDNVSIDVSKALADADANKKELVSIDETVGNNKTSVEQSITTLTNKDISLTNSVNSVTSKADGALSRISTAELTIADNTESIANTKTELKAEFDGLEIGGRNLLKYSNFQDATKQYGIAGGTNYIGVRDGINYLINKFTEDSPNNFFVSTRDIATFNIVEGQTYTLSFLGQSSPNCTFDYTWIIYPDSVNQRIPVYVGSGRGDRRTVTFVAENSATEAYLYLGIDYRLGNTPKKDDWFEIANIKLEKGNKATDWTPAPEDTEEAIAANDARITSEAQVAADANKATADELKTVKATANGNSGTIQTINSTLATHDSAIASTKETLQAQVIGGDNLIPNSDFSKGYSAARANVYRYPASAYPTPLTKVTNTGDSSAFYLVPSPEYRNLKVLAGEEYTLSFHGQATFDTLNYIYLLSSSKPNQNIGSIAMGAGLRNKKTLTFTAEQDLDDGYILLGAAQQANGAWFAFGELQLQKGNKATAWQPSASEISSSLEETKEVVAGVSAQYTIKTDVGGRVSGFGLMSSATQSDFAINADYFWIAPPTGTSKGKAPFMVLTSPRTINGVSVPAGTYIDSAFIHKASIDTAQIRDAAIKSAQIDNLAVTTGKIANLAVDTLQIAGNAITIAGLFYAEQSAFINVAKTEGEIAGLTINAEGGSVSISFGIQRIVMSNYGTRDGATLVLRIKRGSEILRELRYSSGRNANNTAYNSFFVVSDLMLPTILHNPPNGNQRYSVTAHTVNTNEDTITMEARARSLMVSGAKDDK